MIRHMCSGSEDNFDLADASPYDIIPELSKMKKMDVPDLEFAFNHSTIIDHIDDVEVGPENYQDVNTSLHRALRETAASRVQLLNS